MNLQTEAKEHINKLKQFVEKSGIQSDSIVQKEYNYEFNAIKNSTKIKILVYHGKKGIRTIVQGNNSSDLFREVDEIVNEQQSLIFSENEVEEPDDYIGSDEAGKGDLFGPLVIAAVHADKKILSQFKKIGVRDSKELSDFTIDSMAGQIKKIARNNFSIIQLEPGLYNIKYEEYKNLNKLLDWGHSKAIQNLLDNKHAVSVITDKFCKIPLSISLDHNFANVEFSLIEKGEKYTAVAAASILARNSFNLWFMKMAKHGFNLPKGSSDTATTALKYLQRKISREEFYSIAKMHFKTIKNTKK